jgi:hypothetical protein
MVCSEKLYVHLIIFKMRLYKEGYNGNTNVVTRPYNLYMKFATYYGINEYDDNGILK